MPHQHDYNCLVENGNGGVACSKEKKRGSSATSALRKWNEALHKITFNRYSAHVPYGEMHQAALDAGFKVKNEDEAPFMLLGHDGKVDVEYVHPEAPRKTYYLHLTWHRMGTGNFESVAYAN
jgi:hypothetical protein